MSTKGPKRPGRSTGRPRAPKRPSAPAPPSVNTRNIQAEWASTSSGEVSGGSTHQEVNAGRGLPASPDSAAYSAPAVEEPAETSLVDAGAPFAHYGRSMDLSGHFETGRTDSVHVLSVVVIVVACVVGMGVGLGTLTQGLMWWGAIGGSDMAPVVLHDAGHLVDTASATRDGDVAQRRTVRVQAKAVPKALTPAPVSVRIPKDVVFHEFEVSCPGGFRARGRFRNHQASVRSVPPGVACTATFKGSEYARVSVKAGQNLSCTFGPTECVNVR
jgi:hypothetical protein